MPNIHYRNQKNIYLEKHGVLFFLIPKVAVTSMKVYFADYLDMEPVPGERIDIHNPTAYPFPFVPLASLNRENAHLFKFCLCRNPWDRVVSCWRDKIRSPDTKEWGYFDGVAMPLKNNSDRFYGGMPFDEFVDVVCSLPDDVADIHFQSITYMITDPLGIPRVNFIGKMEYLAECLQEISKRTGIPFNKFPHKNTSSRDSYQKYYTPELIEKVRQRYRADVELFDYRFEGSESVGAAFLEGTTLLKRHAETQGMLDIFKSVARKMERSTINQEAKVQKLANKLNELRESGQEKEARILAYRETTEKQRDRIEVLTHWVQDKDKQIQGLNRVLQERNAQLNQNRQILEEREREIQILMHRIEAQDDRMEEIAKAKEEQDRQIIELSQFWEGQVQDLTQSIQDKEAKIRQSNDSLKSAQEEGKVLKELVKAKDTRIQNYLQSFSWKITAPLRKVAGWFN